MDNCHAILKEVSNRRGFRREYRMELPNSKSTTPATCAINRGLRIVPRQFAAFQDAVLYYHMQIMEGDLSPRSAKHRFHGHFTAETWDGMAR
jgi:hypothetical protein